MIHELKCETDYFEAICSGEKPFEVRYNDRGFIVGDLLALNETATDFDSPEPFYTGRCMVCKITYLLGDERFCKPGFVVMGIQPLALEDLRTNEKCVVSRGC